MVGNVVPMLTARPRLEVRGRVAIGDSQLSQIGDNLASILKREIRVELQAISGPWNPAAAFHAFEDLPHQEFKPFVVGRRLRVLGNVHGECPCEKESASLFGVD